MVSDTLCIWQVQKCGLHLALFHFQIISTNPASEPPHRIAMEEVDKEAPSSPSLTHAGVAQYRLFHAASPGWANPCSQPSVKSFQRDAQNYIHQQFDFLIISITVTKTLQSEQNQGKITPLLLKQPA